MSTTAANSATTGTPELVWLDPRALTIHPANVRFDLRNLDELAESITESGIVEPLVVVPEGDGHRILAGHRRAAAAVKAEAELVPCWVRPDLAEADSDQLAAALAENLQRDGLTVLEEANAYAQLAVFPEWSIERIAKTAGRSVTEVRRGVDATKLPDNLQGPAAAGKLSLDEARQLEDFAADPSTYRRLLSHAGERGFAHMLSRARHDLDVDRRLDESRHALETAGIPIIGKPGYHSAEVRLSDLYDNEGTQLDEHDAAHPSCPGHAAYLDPYTGEAVYVCTEPLAHGHSTPPWYRHLSAAEAQAQAAEEEAAQIRAVELEVAAEVRQSFARERIAATGKPPAGTLRLVVETIFDPDLSADLDDHQAEVAWYLGHDDPSGIDLDEAVSTAVRKTTETRLPLLLLAATAAIAEANVAAHESHWGYSPASTARWFGFLTELGYSLSAAESGLLPARQALAEARAEDAATTDDDK